MRREKQKAEVEDEDDAEDDKKYSQSVLAVSSDDEEANEDLSLKLVEKALLMRAAKLAPNGDELGDGSLIDSSYWESEFVVDPNNDGLDGPSGFAASELVDFNKGEIKMEIEKQMVASGDQSVIREEGQKTVEKIKPRQKNEPADESMVQMSDNIVLRKLVRGPRYFDPPDSCWGTCYNCGKEGHTAVNCTAEKRKKPCFVCGNLEHSAKQCTMTRNCFICKKGGHHAKDCPEKYRGGSKSPKICLKCGNAGHYMFSCKYNYSPDDLKDIQCYICKRFGHLCCVDSDDASPIEVSCYKCGQLGHTGLACSRLLEKATRAATRSCYKCGEDGHFSWECTSSAKMQACSRLHREASGAGMPISCFKCGEEGHFSWECTSSAEACGEAPALLSCYKCGEEGHFAWECTILSRKRKRILNYQTQEFYDSIKKI